MNSNKKKVSKTKLKWKHSGKKRLHRKMLLPQHEDLSSDPQHPRKIKLWAQQCIPVSTALGMRVVDTGGAQGLSSQQPSRTDALLI